MCGIVGVVNIGRSTNLNGSLQKMAQSIERRGPDDEGYLFWSEDNHKVFRGDHTVQNNIDAPYFPSEHISSANTLSSQIAFGHRRLSIQDLSAFGHQPMCDKDEKYWIVFNGEIYNYKEIRRELEVLGCLFYSYTDTEVIIHAYAQWGVKALDKFNGMFSFALIDTIKNEVFFARDRIGIKPFYYTQSNDQFIFGSTIQSIIASNLYTPEVDWEGLSQNFSFQIAQRPNTCFENIKAIEPGYYMILDLSSGDLKKERYWDIPTNIQDFSLSEKKAAELLEEALYTSVNHRLISDVEVGSFMSGGVDSTTVSAMASMLQPNIKAFTLAYNGKYSEYNEYEEAAKTAEMHDMDHIVSYVDESLILDNIDSIVMGYEEPYNSLPANFSVSKIVADNDIKVVLSGLGGDELFAGYDLYRKLPRWEKLKKMNTLTSIIPAGVHSKADKVKTISEINDIEQYYAQYYSSYSIKDKQRLFTKAFDSTNVIEKLYKSEKRLFTDNIEAISYYNLKSYIGNHHVRAVDQFTMHFSIEGRFPFLDHNLVELASRIPSKYKIKGDQQKYILKKVAEKYIAPECLNMNKKGFSLPLNHWIKGDLKDFTNDNILGLKTKGLFNNKEIDKIVKAKNSKKIWQLVMTNLWLEKFIK